MTDNTVDVLLDLAHRNSDPDAEVSEQAVFWLHQVDTPEALDALESILTESDDQELQERAIFAISQRSGDGRAAEILKSYAMRRNVPRDLLDQPESGGRWCGLPLEPDPRPGCEPAVGASPYKSVAKKGKHLFRRLAFTVVGRYLPWLS